MEIFLGQARGTAVRRKYQRKKIFRSLVLITQAKLSVKFQSLLKKYGIHIYNCTFMMIFQNFKRRLMLPKIWIFYARLIWFCDQMSYQRSRLGFISYMRTQSWRQPWINREFFCKKFSVRNHLFQYSMLFPDEVESLTNIDGYFNTRLRPQNSVLSKYLKKEIETIQS